MLSRLKKIIGKVKKQPQKIETEPSNPIELLNGEFHIAKVTSEIFNELYELRRLIIDGKKYVAPDLKVKPDEYIVLLVEKKTRK